MKLSKGRHDFSVDVSLHDLTDVVVRAALLDKLEAAGVHNWEGYAAAVESQVQELDDLFVPWNCDLDTDV